MKILLKALGSSIVLISVMSLELQARSVFVNGEDVSASRGQILKKVNVRIDDHGNVHIEAPHYRVMHEDQYTPLSSWKAKPAPFHPQHKPAGKLGELPKSALDAPKTAQLPVPKNNNEQPNQPFNAEESPDKP